MKCINHEAIDTNTLTKPPNYDDGLTPEFPNGIVHTLGTQAIPQRCRVSCDTASALVPLLNDLCCSCILPSRQRASDFLLTLECQEKNLAKNQSLSLFTSAKAEDASRVCAAPAVSAVFHTVCRSSPRLCPWLPSGVTAMRVGVTADEDVT